ncbi:MAG: hypothetical protein JWM68_2635 [Verrucomicrobiales bacterium]|nr:hypothetical protein [Verrucomicrobiales bacterium]
MPRHSVLLGIFLCLFFLRAPLFALEPWEAALAKMPLKTNVTELGRYDYIPLLVESFQENDAAKALIFMPGATDEFYFFRRAHATLTNSAPTVLDALRALTNQSLVRVTFRAPYILVHSNEDPLEPFYNVNSETKVDQLVKRKFIRHVVYNDRDWNSLRPTLAFELDTKILPASGSWESNHFYRHSFAAWNLNDFEILEVMAFAGKTTFTIDQRKIIFEGDKRFRARPPVPDFSK